MKRDPIVLDSDTGEPIQALTKDQHDRVFQFHQTFRDTEPGRKTLAHLEKRFWEPVSFDPNPSVSAFNDGQRSAIAYIRYQLRIYDQFGHLPLAEETDTDAGQSDSHDAQRPHGHYY